MKSKTGPMNDQTAIVSPLRRPLHPDISEELVRIVVHAFYARVRADEDLGPIFEKTIGYTDDEWAPHLQRLCAFWSSVTRLSGRYKGNPMQKHAVLSGIGPQHFDRWLSLFAETVSEHCSPAVAAIFLDKSQRMSATIQRGIFNQRP